MASAYEYTKPSAASSRHLIETTDLPTTSPSPHISQDLPSRPQMSTRRSSNYADAAAAASRAAQAALSKNTSTFPSSAARPQDQEIGNDSAAVTSFPPNVTLDGAAEDASRGVAVNTARAEKVRQHSSTEKGQEPTGGEQGRKSSVGWTPSFNRTMSWNRQDAKRELQMGGAGSRKESEGDGYSKA